MADEVKDADLVVAEFNKNPLDLVRVTLRTYKSKQYVDVRQFYRDDEGEWKPTKKGVSMSTDLLPELRNGVLLAEKRLKKLEAAAEDNEPERKPKSKKSKKSKPKKSKRNA